MIFLRRSYLPIGINLPAVLVAQGLDHRPEGDLT